MISSGWLNRSIRGRVGGVHGPRMARGFCATCLRGDPGRPQTRIEVSLTRLQGVGEKQDAAFRAGYRLGTALFEVRRQKAVAQIQQRTGYKTQANSTHHNRAAQKEYFRDHTSPIFALRQR